MEYVFKNPAYKVKSDKLKADFKSLTGREIIFDYDPRTGQIASKVISPDKARYLEMMRSAPEGF